MLKDLFNSYGRNTPNGRLSMRWANASIWTTSDAFPDMVPTFGSFWRYSDYVTTSEGSRNADSRLRSILSKILGIA